MADGRTQVDDRPPRHDERIGARAVADVIRQRFQWTLITLGLIAGAVATLILVDPNLDGSAVSTPTVSLTSNSRELPEQSRLQVEVRLSEPTSQGVTVDLEVDGSATPGTDFTLRDLRIQIPAGAVTGSVSGRIVRDGELEERETIIVRIVRADNAVVGPNSSITVIIEDVSTADAVAQGGAAPSGPAPGEASVPTTQVPTDVTTTTSASAQPNQQARPPLDTAVLASGSSRDVGSVPLSFVAAEDSVVLVMLGNTTASGTSPLGEVTGTNDQFDLVDTTTRNGGPRRIAVFRTVGTGSQIDAMVSFPSPQSNVTWIVVQVEGVPVGDNGSAAIVQTATSAAEGNEVQGTIQLGPLSSPTATTVGAILAGAPDATGAEGFETLSTAGSRPALIAILGGSPTVGTAEWSGRAHWIGVAIELAT